MKPLLKFIGEYREVYFLGIPALVIIGKVFWPALFVIMPLFTLYLGLQKKYVHTILIFATLLILADHQGLALGNLLNLRTFLIVTMTMLVVYHMRLGYYKITVLFLYFTPFVFSTFLSMSSSPEMNTAVTKAFSFILLYFVAFHYFRYVIRETGDELIRAIVMNAILLLIIGLALIFVNRELVFYGNIRYNGLFRNPNGMGLFVAMMLPFFHYYFKTYQPNRTFKVVCVILITITLMLCSSRNALLGSVLYLIISSGLQGTLYWRLLLFGGVMPLAFVFIQVITIEGLIRYVGLEKYLRLKELRSGSGRVHAWEFALEHIGKEPFLGKGFGYEEYLFKYMMSYGLWKTGHQGGVHNSYLALILNLGIIGLGFLFFFLGHVIVRIRDQIFMVPFLLLYLFTATFESWMVASLNAFHIYFLIMLVFLLEKESYFAQQIEESPVPVH